METKRQKQVGELIRRNFGIVLQQHGSYIFENALVTVTNVIMTPDFALAKVYVSVYNAENKQEVVDSINKQIHLFKPDLVKRLKNHVRRIPNFDIYLDEMVDEMYRVNSLLSKLRDNNQMGDTPAKDGSEV